MLRVVPSKSAAGALKYFSEGLAREDYYSEKQEVVGQWHGKAAQLLGLSGDVTPEAFAALVYNQHPGTGNRLTARTDKDRTVGYDLNFHAPKSLSLLQALTGDEEIVAAFRESVRETMAEIEQQISTRVRQKGAQTNRVTGNFAWAEFVHFTARPVNGIPDPHLHVHGYVFNATRDFVEDRWKAGNFREIKKDAPYSQAIFHSLLTENLKNLGYGIERTPDGWEIAGIPRELIEKFSRRTAQIDRLAEERGIFDDKGRDGLAAESREGKRYGMTHSDLLAAWGVRMTPEDKALVFKAYDREAKPPLEKVTPKMALDEACEKLFAKNSVVQTKRVIAEALHFGVGQVTPDEAWREFERRGMIVRDVKGESLCTSLDVLGEEIALLNKVRNGRGMLAPIKTGEIQFFNPNLSAEQRAAVLHILRSPDQITGIRGMAGVGKTTTMIEVAAQIEAAGKPVFAFATSADASRGTLRKEGFKNAQTLAHLFANPKLQSEVRKGVIWIDEAGLVGIADMARIYKIAGASTPVIVTGDAAQHGPVARGDTFRLLQHYAGLRVAEITEIRRQTVQDYRKAVAALSKGNLKVALQLLEDLNAIVEVTDNAARYRLLAEDFIKMSTHRTVPLVVSPTHAETAKVTSAIREAKREAGLLGPEKSYIRYHDLRWEEPDRRRAENFAVGLVVHFHQKAKGIERGELFRVVGRDEQGRVIIENGRRKIPLPLTAAEHFHVFEERQLALAKGDRIRITRGGKSADGKRLNNGDLFRITALKANGTIVLHTGAELKPDHGHFTHGYCQTSHSSQSKTMKNVLVAQSVDSFLASSREQFYVTVSRGRETVRIYTDSRKELAKAVAKSSQRRAGIELAGFTKGEVGALVSDDSGSKWREMVRKQRPETASHVEKVLRDRKLDPAQKPERMDFRQFIAMKRALAGPDGKSRSKGYSGGNQKTGRQRQNQGQPFLRPTQPKTPPKQKFEAARKEPATGLRPRAQQLVKGYEKAKARLGEVAKKVKGKVAAVRDKVLPKTNMGQVAKNADRHNPTADATKAQTKAKTMQKPPTPPPPGPKRGR